MKKILIVAIVIASAIIAMPSFADNNVGYTATVAIGQQTFVQSVNGAFGTILVGQNKTISNSIVLNNTGDVNATVDAKFTTNVSNFYGFVNSSNVIGASNFSLANATSGWIPLLNAGTDVYITNAPFGTETALAAKLIVPAVPAGAYSGTVQMTFGNVGY
jgi:hypothetical protein